MAFFVSVLTLSFFLAYLNIISPRFPVNKHASFHCKTAFAEFLHLAPQNSLATILLSKPSLSKHRVLYACILILLSGDIETNPGPSHATTELSHTPFHQIPASLSAHTTLALHPTKITPYSCTTLLHPITITALHSPKPGLILQPHLHNTSQYLHLATT